MLIKSLMLLYIPFAFLANAQSSQTPVDPTARDHMRKEKVWLAMKRQISHYSPLPLLLLMASLF